MIQIRRAKRQDMEALAHLVTQLGYPSDRDQIRRRISRLAPGQSAVLVATSGGDALGFVHVAVKVNIQIEPSADIAGLIVAERVRGSGVGRALMQAAEDWALQHRCATVYVSTNVMRRGARSFYRRLGYEPVKESVVFSKRLPAEKPGVERCRH